MLSKFPWPMRPTEPVVLDEAQNGTQISHSVVDEVLF